MSDKRNHIPPTGSRSTKAAKGSSGGADPGRRTLDRVKPPREWRRSRADSSHETAPGPEQSTVDAQLTQVQDHLEGGTSELLVRETTPEPQSAPAPEPTPDLRHQYGEDRLVLLVRDPWWAYAWWEVTENRLAVGQKELSETGRLVLRVYNISLVEWNGQNHHGFFDVDIEGVTGNWYVELSEPGASFCAEVGLRSDSGRFVALVRSNTITLPPDAVSTEVDEQWMIPEEDWQKMFELAGGSSMGIGSSEVRRMMDSRSWGDLSSGSLVAPPKEKDDRRE